MLELNLDTHLSEEFDWYTELKLDDFNKFSLFSMVMPIFLDSKTGVSTKGVLFPLESSSTIPDIWRFTKDVFWTFIV